MEHKTGISLCHFLFLLLTLKMFIPEYAMSQNLPVSIRVGVVVENDYVGEMAWNCISMAVADFYAIHPLYETRLVLTSRNSEQSVTKAAAVAVDLLKNVKVQAIIGPQSSSQANFLIALGDEAEVPIITFAATSPFLSSFRSPYFVRAALDDSFQVKALAALVQAHGWREVVLVYVDNTFGEGIVPYLTSALEDVNARVPHRSVLSPQASDDRIEAELMKLKTMHTRVFIVHVLIPLGSRIFTKAKQLGMMSKEYVWIITDGMAYELDSIHPDAIDSMLGVVGVRPYTPKTIELDDFKTKYNRRVIQNNSTVLSTELNIFGLWAYDATIALAMAVEKAKLRSNLSYLEPNISRNATDIDSIGRSSAGPKLISALSITSFQGLAGKFELVDGQLQSPPFEYVNVVGRGDRVVGYWTKENGIIGDLNFTSTSGSTYSAKRSSLGSIIWPGDETLPAKGWVIPTDGKKLRVGVPVKEGFSEFVKVTWNSDNSVTVGGFCIEIFDEVMKSLPYGVHYEYITFATPDHKSAGKYDDLVNQVYLGNFDAVAGDVTIVANRSQHVDFTLPYMESSISMVVPFTQDNRKNGWIFFKPLTWQLWVTSLGSILVMAFLVWYLEQSPQNKEFTGAGGHQFGMILWFTFSTMVFAQREKVLSHATKLLLIVWFLFVLVLTQSYTANLTSMLTIQRLHPTITDVDTLIKRDLYVGYKNGSFVYDFLVKQLHIKESKLLPFNSPQEMDELFHKGSGNGGIAAAFNEIPYLKLFMSEYCSEYTMVDPIYRADGFGFVFPVGSPLVPDVSRSILNCTEGKTMTDIERNLLSYKEKCRGASTPFSEEDSLPLASFRGLFIIIGAAGCVALIFHVIAVYICRKPGILAQAEPAFLARADPAGSTDSEKLICMDKILDLVRGTNNVHINTGN